MHLWAYAGAAEDGGLHPHRAKATKSGATRRLAQSAAPLVAAITAQTAGALDLLDELFSERARCTKSYVDLSTHEAFGVEPTSFAQFARRHAAEFRPRQSAQASWRHDHPRRETPPRREGPCSSTK